MLFRHFIAKWKFRDPMLYKQNPSNHVLDETEAVTQHESYSKCLINTWRLKHFVENNAVLVKLPDSSIKSLFFIDGLHL